MRRLFGWMLCGLMASVAPQGLAHVHGEGLMQWVSDGAMQQVEWRLPAMDVVGFESAPADAASRARVEAVLARLQQPGQLLEWAPEAGCRLTSAQVLSPWPAQAVGSGAHAVHEHQHEHQHEHEHEHAAPGHGHTDVRVTLDYACTHPEAPETLFLPVFQTLPSLQQLVIQRLDARGVQERRVPRAADGLTRVNW